MPATPQDLPTIGSNHWWGHSFGRRLIPEATTLPSSSTNKMAPNRHTKQSLLESVGSRLDKMFCRRPPSPSLQTTTIRRSLGSGNHLCFHIFLSGVEYGISNGRCDKVSALSAQGYKNNSISNFPSHIIVPSFTLGRHSNDYEGNFTWVRHTGVSRRVEPPVKREEDWWGIVSTATLPIQLLVESIREGRAIAVTDGSFKDNLGTAAYTFRRSLADTRSITFVHMTPGMPSEISPYRAEIGGLYGIASFLFRLHERYDLQGGHVTVACDCQAALIRTEQTFPPDPKGSNFDLLSEIYHLKTKTPITWTTKWVRGHQDSTSAGNLDTWARMNIEMDLLAKTHWQRLNSNRPRPFSLPNTTGVWSLWLSDQRIARWDRTTADALYFNSAAREYWEKKYDHLAVLDYEAIRMAYRSINLFYQLRVPKWLGQRLPVGEKVASWSPSNPDICPRCGTAQETHSHIITCQHPGAIALIDNWLDQLELWMAKEHTKPDLRFGILSLLRARLRDLPWVPPNTSDPNVQRTFQKQQELGTENVIYGWWHVEWAETQHAYLASLSRRNTGRRWLSRLIKKQWEIAWDLWRHRMQVAASPDSHSLALLHGRTNQDIRHLYRQLSRTTYPPLRRWFQQPQDSLLHQPLAFKQDWILLVRSFHDPNVPAT